MKSFLLFFSLMIVQLSFSQVTKGNENNNQIQNNTPAINVQSNTNSTNNGTNFQLNSTVMDSVVFKESDKNVTTSKKLKTKSESDTNKEEAVKIQQKQAVSSKFVATKVVSSTQRTQRTPTPVQQATLDEQVQELKAIDSSSFEYNLYNYSSGNYNVDRESYLKKAEKQQPLNKEVVKLNVANCMVKGDTVNAKKYLQQFTEQQQITQESIAYTADMLTSSGENSTLITHGLQDTYGALQNQLNSGFGTQVDVISLDFMQSESYRNLLSNKGYNVPASSVVNVGFFQSFIEMNASHNISLSLTIPKEYFEPIKSKLYLSGLVFEYRTATPDNTYVKLEDFWYNRFNKLVLNLNTSNANKYAANYLPTVLFLKDYYQRTNNTLRLQEMNKAYEEIGLKTGKIKKKN